MEIIIPIVSVIFLGFLANRLNKSGNANENIHTKNCNDMSSIYEPKHESEEQKHQHTTDKVETEQDPFKSDTLCLMLNTLSNIGCQPTKNSDDTISVKYQGENFHIEIGGMYASIWDPMWTSVKVDDPNIQQIREAVNLTNFTFGPTVVMTQPDDEGMIGLHSRRDIMLHPSCPDNIPFIKAVLDSFFEKKEQVRSHYQHIQAQQVESQKKRRPIGFRTQE